MAENIYQNLVRTVDKSAPMSIHLCNFPVANMDWIDAQLEENMDAVLQVVVLGRAGRNESNIKNRQPIGEMFVQSNKELPDDFISIIADELNIKKVSFVDDASGFTTYQFKPQMRTLGPKYGKMLNSIRTALTLLDGTKAMDELKSTGLLKLDVEDTTIELTEDDLLIDTAQKEGLMAQSDRGYTVVLDTTLTPELIEEGFVRELISKLQTMRREADFEVQDYIEAYYDDNDHVGEIIERNADQITKDVLATSIKRHKGEDGYKKAWKVNGEDITLVVSRK